jgi:predicted proteasome-type protease
MDKIQKYKKMYPSEANGNENLVVDSNGKLIVPNWLIRYLVDSSGLKSKKKRLVKKVLKKQLIKIVKNYAETEN